MDTDLVARHVERLDEDALLARVRQGDALAFAELDRRFRPRLLAAARSLLRGPPQDPEDAVQDVLLRAHRFLLRHPERPVVLGAWLRVVLRNRCLDLRDERREHAAQLEDRAGPDADPVRILDQRDQLRHVLTELAGLPPRQRTRSSGRCSRAPRTSSSRHACRRRRP